ncbi:hypothetical protein CYL31_13275 [Marinomonas sp. A3A]|nr:hypothetical protein CYL31_13275 [Marinomonas sp. A3A]
MKIRELEPHPSLPLNKGKELGRSRVAHRALHFGVFKFSYEVKRGANRTPERGQTSILKITSSGGVWFAASAEVAVRVKAFPLAL